MFRNIYLKSLFEKRWSVLGWSIAIIFMAMLTALLFPTFKESFGESLQEVPDSMKAFFGDASTFQVYANFVDIQVIAQMVFITIIMGIIIGSGFIAGDEGNNTLQSLLAQPVKRSKVYTQKYLALMGITFFASLMIFLAVFISAQIINESMDWWRMAQATFGVWLITFVFGSAAFALGAYTGKRGLSGSLIGFLAFVSYMITSLAVGIDALKTVDRLSPFHYFNTPSIIQYGLDWGNVAVLLGIIAAVTLIGYLKFIKRDIKN